MARGEGGGYWIGTIWIDGVITESHGLEAAITRHAVETGANPAEHIRPLSPTLTLECVVSNTPIREPLSHASGAKAVNEPIPFEGERESPAVFGINLDQPVRVVNLFTDENVLPKKQLQARVLHFDREFDRVREVKAAIKRMWERGELFSLYLTQDVLHDFAITRAQQSIDIKSGNAYKFTITCEQMSFAVSEAGEVPEPKAEVSKAPKKSGKQGTTTSDADAAPSDSFLWALTHPGN